jgi:hypothetical protein
MCHLQQPDLYLQGVESHLLIQGQHCLFEGISGVRSITFLSLKGFCKYLPQLFTTMRQSVMHNNWSPTSRSRSHLRIQGQHCLFEGICRVRSITFLSMKGFCKYLPQLFTIMTRCVMRNNWSPTSKVKVTLGGQ